MAGDDRSRHCEQCSLKVHNISGMTRPEAEAFLASTLGTNNATTRRVCARFFRRADGTILTADCPVGLAALRAKARRTATRIAAAVGLTSLVAWAAAHESANVPFARVQPLTAAATYLRGGSNPFPAGRMVMGDVAVPTPPQPVLKWIPGAQQ